MKANDVDYFADAYLKVLGVELQDEDASQIRENRIYNTVENGDGPLPEVNFLEISSDTTQENLISLLKESIFISMVLLLCQAEFGNSSGTAAFRIAD